MSLIIVPVYDTVENGRTEYTEQSLNNILDTVDLYTHTLFIADNGSCESTQKIYGDIYKRFIKHFPPKRLIIFRIGRNEGISAAMNYGLRTRKEGQYVIKHDNDIIVKQCGWVEEMEGAMKVEPNIGLCGFKRKDCWEHPGRNDAFKSELFMLPHKEGERWIIGEKTENVIGSCVMHNPLLLDKIGYYKTPSVYGFADKLLSMRSLKAGFINCFLPHIEIEHLDPMDSPYQREKEGMVAGLWDEFNRMKQEIEEGNIKV